MKKSPNGTKLAVAFALFTLFMFNVLVLTEAVSALSVNPQRQQLTNPSEQSYQYIYTVTNNDPVPRTLVVQPERNSIYLKDKISVSPEQFSLLPSQSENVRVSINPAGLGPQTHTLLLGIYDGTEKTGQMDLLVVVPGTPIERFGMDINLNDITTGSLLPIEVGLQNFGNIIGYAQLTLEILRQGEVVGSLVYPETVQVLPAMTTEIVLPYTADLEPGFYSARVKATYPNEELTSEKQFSVSLGSTKQVIKLGSDLELTFESMGNPPEIAYLLVDSNRNEVASGRFVAQEGNFVVPMNDLPVGQYTLSLAMSGATRQIEVEIHDSSSQYQTILLGITLLIALIALFSLRKMAFSQLRLFRLKRKVAQQEREVTNLINRSHKLVDEYAAYAAKHNEQRGREP